MKEIWKPIKDWEDYYAISNRGRLKSFEREYYLGGSKRIKKERIATAKTIGKRYVKYTLYLNKISKTISVHRLVAEAFIDNPLNLPYINHINGNKIDNRVENLEWCTPRDNVKHAYRIGLSKQDGENHATLKLNWEKVRQIRKLHSQGVNKHQLGERFSVHSGHINNIIANLYWKEK